MQLDSARESEVWAQLERLMSAPAFASSRRRGQLLRYLVERALAADRGPINEYAIGVDVFERPPSFDPRIESIVRTEAARLRQRLKEYYAADGRQDRVVIEIPLRTYEPAFLFREPDVPATPPSPHRIRSRAAFAGVALIALLAAGGAALWWLRYRTNPPIRSLVVLPFQNFSPGGADEYLSDGLTDELTNELANWKEIRVVARTSAYQYKGKGEDVRRIGRDLNVDAVLEGSLARQGERVRITAQLNRTSDGYHLWSHSYDSRSLDMLAVQREIAQAIAAAIRRLGIKVPNEAGHPSTNNPEALDLFLRASYQYARLTPESLQESIELFQAAIAKDPSYARAYTGLAAAEMELTNFKPLAGGMARAQAALNQALKLDPDAGDPHGLLAQIVIYNDWDWSRSLREFQLALEKGAQPSTRAAYGWTLSRLGRFQEAQAQCTAAENLEPLGVAPRFCQFYVHYHQRQYAAARKLLLQTLDLRPDLIYAHVLLARIALLTHDCGEAARQFAAMEHKLPSPADTVNQAYECVCLGQTDRARRYLHEAAASDPPAESLALAMGYALLGDKDATVANLRKSADAHKDLNLILNEPVFDPIRSDPRYLALEHLAMEPRP